MMLITMGERHRIRERLDRIKVAVLNREFIPEGLHQVFPDLFEADPFSQARQEDGTFDPDLVDEDVIEWDLPRSAREDQEISDWIEKREQGSIRADALDDEWR